MTSQENQTKAHAALPKIRKVCVIGGAGFVGRHIVHLLDNGGYEVRVPTRHRERAKDLIVLPGVDVVEADIHDPSVLSSLLEGMDAVINLVGILHEKNVGRIDKPSARRGDFHQAHIELPRKIVQACAKHGIKRVLHMSALNADATSSSAYLRSKGAGEAMLREVGQPHSDNERWYLDGPKFTRGQRMAVTVFRPSVIFGPEDSFLNQFACLLRRLPVMALACGQSKLQPVYVEDVARAFVLSLENPATYDQAYDLCGPKIYTLQQLVAYVAQLQGIKRPLFSLNDRLSYFQAWLLEMLPGKLMTRDDYYALLGNSVCGCDFPAVFGFQPTTMEVIAPKYLAQGVEHSHYDGFRCNARR
ncbi:MAG: complex I NDUFA9 subunit family protein [Burkholderiales bacterium]|nr:complex I NDUFA9 subunit family protein [Burkholderiales bacterium]